MTDSRVLLEQIIAEYEAGEHDRDMLVRVLCEVRDLRADLASFAADVTRDLLPLATEKKFIVSGLGEVTVRKQTKRTAWQHDQLLPALIARIMDEKETLYDPETGELLPYTQIGHNLTARLRACVSFGAGKVTGLRSIGLQPDEFCTETPDGWGVELPARQ